MTSPSICLVAILKDEETFLDEWLVYHRMIGIDHFFLYDDDPQDLLTEFVSPHNAFCTVISWHTLSSAVNPETRMSNQVNAYWHAVENYIRGYDWVVFLDGDEFIVLKEHQNIKSFLSGLKGAVSISLNWHIFGHNGYYDDPDDLITVSLTKRKALPSKNVKTLTRTDAIAGIRNAHFCQLKYGGRIDTNGKPYQEELYQGKTAVAHINHYQCRSFKNWMGRVKRGDVNFNEQNYPPGGKWRIDEETCLKQFVRSVTLDKNEYLDEYMLKYEGIIRKEIHMLNRAVPPSRQIINQQKTLNGNSQQS